MATLRGVRGGVRARVLGLLLGACLAAPAFASGSESAAAPILVSDPGSGAAVVIWSDGATAKLSWARRDGSAWGPAHELTFGPGMDVSPAVGIARTGTWLFWLGEKGQVFSAPIDLSRGHLLAVPHTLSRGNGGASSGTSSGATGVSTGGLAGLTDRGLTVGLGGGSIRPEAGQDVPVILHACDPANPVMPCIPGSDPGPGTRDIPPQINPEGGQDTPINVGTAGTGTPPTSTNSSGNLSVHSDPGCDSQLVTVIEGRQILVLEVRGSGEIASRMRLRVASGLDMTEAAAVAGDYYLRTACH